MMSEDVAPITTDSRTEYKRVTNEDLLAVIDDLRADDADRDRLPTEARMNVDPGTKRYDVLWIVFESGPITAAEVADRLGKSATGVLTRLHDAFLIDRDGDRYEVNDLGRDALNGGNQTLDDIDADPAADDPDSSDDDPADPWDDTPLTQIQYEALQAIDETSGHPTTSEAIEHYAPDGYAHTQTALAAQLWEMFQDGFVDRTPSKPYHYWLTDDGEALLE